MQLMTCDDYKIALHKLQHQVVRDLAWCCFSPPMMNELPGSHANILPFDNQSLWPWLYTLDRQPQVLLEHLHQIKSTRLGIYYEALWHFYFANHPQWELLKHNLQIDRNGVTLGAFDFLCRRGEEYWHIETAVKFYLCSASNTTDAQAWKYWMGPEGQDRLDLKLNHLRQHQLPLHQFPEAKYLLETLYPDAKNWHTGLCLQGYLFSPAQHTGEPAFSHPHHGRGHWWFARDILDRLSEYSPAYWLILERNQWLSPAHETGQGKLLTNNQLGEKIYGLDLTCRPLLIALMQLQDPGDVAEEYWIEESRLFVVPDGWPHHSDRPGTASPSRKT
jgi:uncharacterized protein